MSDSDPIAWAAVGKKGQPMWLSYSRQDAESAVVGMADVVPLYRSPTLTDAERSVLEVCATHWQTAPAAKTIRALMERLK